MIDYLTKHHGLSPKLTNILGFCTCISYHVYHNSNNETYNIYQFIVAVITITAFEDGNRESHTALAIARMII